MGILILLATLTAPPADLEAVGIIVGRRADACVAILRAGGRERVVGIGEPAFGGKVTAIVPGRVSLDFGGERVEVRLAGAAPVTPPPLPPPAPLPHANAKTATCPLLVIKRAATTGRYIEGASA